MSKYSLSFTARFRFVRKRLSKWLSQYQSHLKRELALIEEPRWKIESEPQFLTKFLKKNAWLERSAWFLFIVLLITLYFEHSFCSSEVGKILYLVFLLCSLAGNFFLMGISIIRFFFVLSQWRKIFVWK